MILRGLRSHEIDFEYNGSAALYPQYLTIAGARTLLTPFNQFGVISFYTSQGALTNRAVRQALKYATDTSYIRVQLGHGTALPGYSVQPVFSWAYDPNVKHFPYDLAVA